MLIMLMRLLRQLSPGLRRTVLNGIDGAWLNRRLAAHGTVVYRYRDRRINVDLRDRVGRQMIKHGFTEQPFITLIEKHFTDSGCCFLDIGANLGNYSLALAPHFAKTIAFEPNPPVFKRLTQNVEYNPDLQIEPFNCGLSSQSGTLAFYPNNEGNSGASGFEAERMGIEPLELETSAGDEFAASIDIRIAAIKIDVEGHELEVIRGLEKTIANDQPVIFMEWLGDTMDRKGGFEALEALLPGYRILVPGTRPGDGHKIKTAAPKHRLTQLMPLQKPYRKKYNMIFCVPQKIVARVTQAD